MEKTKRSAAVDEIEKGPHKDKHLNQYGDQRKDSSRRIHSSANEDAASSTISKKKK